MSWLVVLTFFVATPAAGQPSSSAPGVSSEQITLGGIRASYEAMRQGLSDPSLAKTWTEQLVQWIDDSGHRTDAALVNATVNLIALDRSQAINPKDLDGFCTAAVGCRKYMAIGSGWTERELEMHVSKRHLESATALRKMMAVARNNHLPDDQTLQMFRDALAIE